MRITKSLLILTIAILAAAIILFLTMQKPPSFCSKVQDRDAMYLCLGAVQNDISYCQRIQDDFWQSVCFEYLAIQQKNSSICELISDHPSKTFMGDALSVYESSRDVCYYQFAVRRAVPSLCNLTLENASCWKDFAIKTGNTTFGEEIQEPNDRNSCLAEVTSDISYCDKIVPEHSDAASNISFSEEFNAESDRVWCYIHVANRTQNASICEIGRGQKGLDNEFCYSMAGFCDLVENEDDKINCFSMETANVSYCDLSFNMEMSKVLIGSESNESHYKTAIFNRDVCYEVQASLQRNISLCYKINDEKSKEYCYSTVAVKRCDPLLCDINVDRHDKDECIGWIIKSQCMLR